MSVRGLRVGVEGIRGVAAARLSRSERPLLELGAMGHRVQDTAQARAIVWMLVPGERAGTIRLVRKGVPGGIGQPSRGAARTWD